MDSLLGTYRFRKVIRDAQSVLHGDDASDEGCERACYECLLSFYNQRDHEYLDRTIVESWLDSMEEVSLSERDLSPSSFDREHMEELLMNTESDFEADVLLAIRDNGFDLPDEAQKTIYDDGKPVASADFYYDRSGRSIVIFVDGPDHMKDYVSDDDEEKRTQLKRMGYRVITVTDGDQVTELWDNI